VSTSDIETRGTPTPVEQIHRALTQPLLNPVFPLGSSKADELKVHDTVRLTRDLDGVPSDSEGIIVGWYTNQPDQVLVRLFGGEVESLPRDALELVEVNAVALDRTYAA
jgi:hypothetical protein